MTERRRLMRWGGASSFLAALILTVMIAVVISAGPDSSQLLQPTDSSIVSRLMDDYSVMVQTSVILDDLFVVTYTMAFMGLAALVWPSSRWLAGVAMLFALATAVLDFSENARLLSMAQDVGGKESFTDSALGELHIITQLKYSCSHLATFMLGLSLPKRDRLSWIVAILLLLFPVTSTLAFVLDPASMARILLMWLLLVFGGWLIWRSSVPSTPDSTPGNAQG